MKIWIFNHYGIGMFTNCAGRHHWFAKYLNRKGHEVELFSANTAHSGNGDIDTGNNLSIKKSSNDGIEYCFIKTSAYKGNGISRINNMIGFYRNLKRVCKKRISNGEKPDVILASSVHPLTLVAAIQLSKKNHIPCVCEVRDLWPFALVVYNRLKEEALFTKILYKGEHWIYKRADELIFTFNGGQQYIIDKDWQYDIELEKVHYINNGIDLEGYDENLQNCTFDDEDLNSDDFKVVYTGTMGPPNQINQIVDAAIDLRDREVDKVRFILFGDGVSKNSQEQRCKDEGLSSVIFKGRVEKGTIPFILSKSDAAIIMEKESRMNDYGTSENKVFDYLAAGKPIICNDECIRSIVGSSDCVIVDKNVANAVEKLMHLPKDEIIAMGKASKELSQYYNYQSLTDELEKVLYKAVSRGVNK